MNEQLVDSGNKQLLLDLLGHMAVPLMWTLTQVITLVARLMGAFHGLLHSWLTETWLKLLLTEVARDWYLLALGVALSLAAITLIFFSVGIQTRWVRASAVIRWPIILILLVQVGLPLYGTMETMVATAPDVVLEATGLPSLDVSAMRVTVDDASYTPTANPTEQADLGSLIARGTDERYTPFDLLLAVWHATPADVFGDASAITLETEDGPLAVTTMPPAFAARFFPALDAVSGESPTQPQVRRGDALARGWRGTIQAGTGLLAALATLLPVLMRLTLTVTALLLFVGVLLLAPFGLFGTQSVWVGLLIKQWWTLTLWRVGLPTLSLLLTHLLYGSVGSPGLILVWPLMILILSLYVWAHWRLTRISWRLLGRAFQPLSMAVAQVRGASVTDSDTQRERTTAELESSGLTAVTPGGTAQTGMQGMQAVTGSAKASMLGAAAGGFGMLGLVEGDMQAATAARTAPRVLPTARAGQPNPYQTAVLPATTAMATTSTRGSARTPHLDDVDAPLHQALADVIAHGGDADAVDARLEGGDDAAFELLREDRTAVQTLITQARALKIPGPVAARVLTDVAYSGMLTPHTRPMAMTAKVSRDALMRLTTDTIAALSRDDRPLPMEMQTLHALMPDLLESLESRDLAPFHDACRGAGISYDRAALTGYVNHMREHGWNATQIAGHLLWTEQHGTTTMDDWLMARQNGIPSSQWDTAMQHEVAAYAVAQTRRDHPSDPTVGGLRGDGEPLSRDALLASARPMDAAAWATRTTAPTTMTGRLKGAVAPVVAPIQKGAAALETRLDMLDAALDARVAAVDHAVEAWGAQLEGELEHDLQTAARDVHVLLGGDSYAVPRVKDLTPEVTMIPPANRKKTAPERVNTDAPSQGSSSLEPAARRAAPPPAPPATLLGAEGAGGDTSSLVVHQGVVAEEPSAPIDAEIEGDEPSPIVDAVPIACESSPSLDADAEGDETPTPPAEVAEPTPMSMPTSAMLADPPVVLTAPPLDSGIPEEHGGSPTSVRLTAAYTIPPVGDGAVPDMALREGVEISMAPQIAQSPSRERLTSQEPHAPHDRKDT